MGLEPRDREILLLAEWEGLSTSQIAGVMGCLAVTARGRLHRARRRFRSAYDELLLAGGEPPRRRAAAPPMDVRFQAHEGGSR